MLSAVIRWTGIGTGVLFVLLVTTLPLSIPLMRYLSRMAGSVRFGDSITHICLYALLMLLLYAALREWRLHWQWALPLALIAALGAGVATEYAQRFVGSRSFTLADLLANWVGAFAAAFALSYYHLIRHTPRLQPAHLNKTQPQYRR
jgi:VanZ family protein